VTVKRALAGHTLYRLGVLITLFWVAVALLAPWIAPYSPTQGDAALAKGSPSFSHLFGLDKYGRDILTRVVYGSRYDLCIAVTVVGCSLVVGTLIGSITQSTTNISWAVLNAAGLSFLGVGIQPPTPEWGVMISEGSPFIVSGQWWMSFFPGAALILMTAGFILLGDGLSARTER
jgi:ABC-type dipeptide/oligopeptide/nickel transport system permease subunit